jgi:hypothetical protein
MKYQFFYVDYDLPGEIKCDGHTSVQWCKVYVLRSVVRQLSNHKYVLYLDSDAFFNHWLPVDQFLHIAEGRRSKIWNGRAEVDETCPSVYDPNVALMLPEDTGTYVSNTGINIWRPGSIALNIFDAWIEVSKEFDSSIGQLCCEGFPYEQGVMKRRILSKFNRSIVRVHSGNDTWHLRESDGWPDGFWITHCTSRYGGKRAELMDQAISTHADAVQIFRDAVQNEKASVYKIIPYTSIDDLVFSRKHSTAGAVIDVEKKVFEILGIP